MSVDVEAVSAFPRPLSEYAASGSDSLLQTLVSRLNEEPFNAIATLIFAAAIVHTFAAPRLMALAHTVQHRHVAELRARGRAETPSVAAEILHLFGEIEVVFGVWAVALMAAIALYTGWDTARDYLSHTVDYTEALFVVVIMALSSTRPVVAFAEAAMRKVARVGGGTPAAWWATILVVGPLMGSFITEPAAMTISALLLARKFFDLQPSTVLRYATLGVLFVNVSIGGTLTHFAAPPVLMVARPWEWDTLFMLQRFGWRAAIAVVITTSVHLLWFRRELTALASIPQGPDLEIADEEAVGPRLLPVPAWLVVVHLLFIAWTVINSHYPALFLGGFLFFLGVVRATSAYQSQLDLKAPLLVGFFLAGLVIHGGLQGWWIAPLLGSLSSGLLFVGAAALTAFNDNALITYLSTLVPSLDGSLRVAVVQGAVVGGGLTVIANAPNPAGQALLARFFGGTVSPARLALAALTPTLIAAAVFRLL